MLEQLRAAGLPAVGAEDLLFDQDASEEARFLLGGEITEIASMHYALGSEYELTVQWRLFDRRLGEVVYTTTTRGYTVAGALGDAGVISAALLEGAVSSLVERSALSDALRVPSETDAAFDAVVLRSCPTPDPERRLEPALDAALVLEQGASSGSGVMISPDGFALTAAHVVEAGIPVIVRNQTGLELEAELLRRDPIRDVALLRVPGRGHPCLPPVELAPPVGADLYAVGAPLGEALSFSVSRGIVSGRREADGASWLQTDASINPGNSGGPLVDSEAQLVAIASWKIAGDGVEGLGFGVPVADAAEALGIAWGDATGEVPEALAAAPPAAAHEDPADPSRLGESAEMFAPYQPSSADLQLVSGVVLTAGGAALIAGTWGVYKIYDDDIGQAGWIGLKTVNTAGWIVALGGVGLGISGISGRDQPTATLTWRW